MSARKICVLTGTRAEFGLLRPVMEAIQQHPDLELQVLVTGMHLEQMFGMSVKAIEGAGFPISGRVPMHPPEDSGKGMAFAMGDGIRGMTKVLGKLKPDILLLLGDRTEVMAGAITALYLNIPIAHIHGGDVTRGGTDESTRHAVTKMASIHFAATPQSAERILKMGEEPWRIHTVGAPALDTILNVNPLSRSKLARRFNLPEDRPWFLVLQHSVTTEAEIAGEQFAETLAALDAFDVEKIFIYPNSDAGGLQIIAQLERIKTEPGNHVFPSIPHREFLSLMNHCSVMVGNSSSGIIESSTFKIPVVNIGIRQEGRECAGNVVHVGHDRQAIETAIDQVIADEFMDSLENIVNPYGDGNASRRIVDVLSTVELDKKLIQKQITY
ncbi:MAG: UDP-N-acetylglucosamine 2-epimerase (hydrolyzing) [Bacteroidetes bacterium]|nr:UDP-N-acetylglucosamine 2-epimerase (hydrolyzing) [Bacteroidota bacterium]MBL0015096.1 UDP-N-acetylglucosamine 2-epimerase (hydrolyzing) [Bacteroidota bacterium]MBP6639241.1 UDP-N-acetylglucosamine 2-epimerase (hydrolyzing) [Bacteroidia bacterium]MBP8074215.1 UDP-N-acetylglucosamine 2-epimerase (hydrolyzing) [Bacteroidia bacterium]